MFEEISHRLFLYVVTQLLTTGQMQVSVCGRSVVFQIDNHTGKWLISTKVSDPSETSKECFHTQSKAIFHQPHSYLVEGERGVYFQRTIQPVTQYILFRSILADYLSEASDWKKILS